MSKIILAAALLFSLPSIAETYEHGDLIMGHFSFDPKMDSRQVGELGKQLLKDDPGFDSMAVVGVGPRQWGLYFRYNKSDKVKTNAEFSKVYQEKLKKAGASGRYGISASDGVVVLK